MPRSQSQSLSNKHPVILFTCYLFEAPKILKMPAYTEPQTPNMHKLELYAHPHFHDRAEL